MSDAINLWAISALPAPPGQTSNFVDPPTQTNSTIALHTVLLTVVTLCITMRLYTRKFISHEVGSDDYCIIVAYILTIAFSTLLIIGDTKGLGRHMWDVPAAQLPEALEALTIAEFVYLVLAGVIKLSCLLFYRRVFSPNRATLICIWVGIVFITVSYTAMLFSTIFECTPVRRSWNALTPGHCYPPQILPYFSGALNVVTDLYVLIVPIPALWHLNLKLARKLRVMVIFALGIFVCATSIIRLAMTTQLYSDTDASWNLSNIGKWSVIEVNTGIICSCLLALPAFMRRHWPETLSTSIARFMSYPFGTSRGVNSGAYTGKQDHKGFSFGQGKRSDRRLDSDVQGDGEYLKLGAKGSATELNYITAQGQPGQRGEDTEAWPKHIPLVARESV